MHSAFEVLVWLVCGAAVIIALVTLLLSRRTWREYRDRHLLLDRDEAVRPPAESSATSLEWESEIRQLLGAHSARRLRRGQGPVDVERELARLRTPAVEPELRAEIRGLVLARNRRRVRHGQPPLDVEAEIERQIAALGDL